MSVLFFRFWGVDTREERERTRVRAHNCVSADERHGVGGVGGGGVSFPASCNPKWVLWFHRKMFFLGIHQPRCSFTPPATQAPIHTHLEEPPVDAEQHLGAVQVLARDGPGASARVARQPASLAGWPHRLLPWFSFWILSLTWLGTKLFVFFFCCPLATQGSRARLFRVFSRRRTRQVQLDPSRSHSVSRCSREHMDYDGTARVNCQKSDFGRVRK